MRQCSLYTVALFATVISSCVGLRNISEEDPLFVGNEFDIEGPSSTVKEVIRQTDEGSQPQPNNRFLWMRPALARYNMLSDSGRNKKFWKRKVSEPVLVSQTTPDYTSRVLGNRIYHQGFFQNSITFDTIRIGSKKAKFRYTINLQEPYRLGTVRFPEGNDDLSTRIQSSSNSSLLKTGDIYSLQTIKEERARINRYLKNYGYLYFNPEFLYLEADSVSQQGIINLAIKLKPTIPPESKIAYKIGRIYSLDDYSLNQYLPDTLDQDPYYFLSTKQNLRPETIRRGIFQVPGNPYSDIDHSRTLQYLNSLPIVQSASIRYLPGSEKDELNSIIYLTKRRQFAYTAELNTIFRSTNYFGPGVIFSFINRNHRDLGEQLKINLRGRFEMQIADGEVNPAYELGLELNYLIPQLKPGIPGFRGKAALPQTVISTGYNLFNRLDLYRLNSVFLDFGYRWKRNEMISHRFDPIGIIFTQIPESSKSDEFRDYLDQNPGVRRSFEEQLVFGAGYEFTYDPRRTGKSEFYFRGGIDFAGNLLSGAYNLFNAEKDSSGNFNLFGVPFSQFARARLDFRYGFRLGPGTELVTRFVTGLGIPFGNSDILPYIKQFYVGGTNSLRSFVARTVGPGGEVPPEGFRDLTGDIRLEWNLEYRFTLAGNLKSALFLDMGNVWLYNDDPARPNGVFKFSTFMDEVAVSSGFGFRWDFDFVVARLDLAYTLRTPYLAEGEKWNSDFNIWKPTWNIAVGYPF